MRPSYIGPLAVPGGEWYYSGTTHVSEDRMPVKPIVLALRLPPALHARATRAAKQETRSLNSLVIVALAAYLNAKGAK